MTATLTLRPARASDAELICLIYNQGIEDRVATLETELRTPAERREWMAVRGPRHPVIVAESAGSVVGWGSLNVFNARPAYQHVADFSVYVDRKWRGPWSGAPSPRAPRRDGARDRLSQDGAVDLPHECVGRAALRGPGLHPGGALPGVGLVVAWSPL